MAKERTPTPEERRLWQAVTRHDVKLRTEDPVAADDAPRAIEPLSPLPADPVLPAARGAPRGDLSVQRGRQAQRLLKAAPPIQATLDLHGYSKLDAHARVQQFVQQAQRQGMRHVLIITGKGRIGEGVLRAHVPHWLNEPPLRALLSGLAYPPANRGGDGVLHVLVKRA